MKIAILFIISLYIGIPSVALMPVLVGNHVESDALFWILIIFIFLVVTSFMFVSGIACVIKTANSDSKSAARMWRTMKLASVPIYVANFLFLTMFGMVLFPGTVIIGFASGFFCCSSIVLSGITGIAAIKKKLSDGKSMSKVHYGLQLIPVIDVISTLILIRK